jgi:ABC-type phosphate transport system permease subunit
MILKWLLKIFAFALVLLLAFVILLFVLDAISQAKKFHFNRKQKAFFLELKNNTPCAL